MIECSRIVFSGHALRRMFERGIGKVDIDTALSLGETIAVYSDDIPYPSRLILAFIEERPLHVLVAQDGQTICYIVTCYQPDLALWQDGFRTRRTS